MAIKIIKMPEVEPITIDEVKQHLRISDNDEDIIVGSMIKQAREFCEDFQNRKLVINEDEAVIVRRIYNSLYFRKRCRGNCKRT